MKTSVIDVHEMLSVLSVSGVEQRIGEVPGVESVTVNHAAGSATVRYDETRLQVADIKSNVRQRGYESADEPTPPQVAPATATPAVPAAVQDAAKPDVEPAPPAATALKEAPPIAPPEPPALAKPAARPETAASDPPAGLDADAQEPGLVEKATTWVDRKSVV